MNTDQEGLLFSSSNGSPVRHNGSTYSRWRKKIFLLIMAMLIIVCLTVYLYLNMEVIDNNQLDSAARYKPLSRRKPMLDHESIFSDSGPSMIKLSDLLAHCIVALRIAGQEVVNLSLAHNDKLNHIGSKGKTLEGVDDVITGADMISHKMILSTIKDSYSRLRVVSEEDTTVNFDDITAEDDILPIDRKRFAKLLRQDLHEIEDQHADRGSLIAQHETLVWIDPLDATKEYSENLTDYVTLMACIVHKSIPIAGVIFKPFTNETYWSMVDYPTSKFHQSSYVHLALSKAAEKLPQNENITRVIVSRSHAGEAKSVLERAYGQRASIISAGGSGYKTVELLRGDADVYMHLTHIKKWDICAPYAILSSLPDGKLTDLSGDTISFGDPKSKVVTRGLIASLKPKVHKEMINLMKDYNRNSNKHV